MFSRLGTRETQFWHHPLALDHKRAEFSFKRNINAAHCCSCSHIFCFAYKIGNIDIGWHEVGWTLNLDLCVLCVYVCVLNQCEHNFARNFHPGNFDSSVYSPFGNFFVDAFTHIAMSFYMIIKLHPQKNRDNGACSWLWFSSRRGKTFLKYTFRREHMNVHLWASECLFTIDDKNKMNSAIEIWGAASKNLLSKWEEGGCEIVRRCTTHFFCPTYRCIPPSSANVFGHSFRHRQISIIDVSLSSSIISWSRV